MNPAPAVGQGSPTLTGIRDSGGAERLAPPFSRAISAVRDGAETPFRSVAIPARSARHACAFSSYADPQGKTSGGPPGDWG